MEVELRQVEGRAGEDGVILECTLRDVDDNGYCCNGGIRVMIISKGKNVLILF